MTASMTANTTDTTTALRSRLQAIRSLRYHANFMYQSLAAPISLPGKVSGSMAIKMAYEQVGREEYARRFKDIVADLDRQEREVLAKLGEDFDDDLNQESQ